MNRDWHSLVLRRRALSLESTMLRVELQAKREALQARLASPLGGGGAGALLAMALRYKVWRWVFRALPVVGLVLKFIRSRK